MFADLTSYFNKIGRFEETSYYTTFKIYSEIISKYYAKYPKEDFGDAI